MGSYSFVDLGKLLEMSKGVIRIRVMFIVVLMTKASPLEFRKERKKLILGNHVSAGVFTRESSCLFTLQHLG